MSSPPKCRTVLVEDIPADVDVFGTHDRVAEALADLIRSDTNGGKIIGVEGGWGAGKTTVIRLLERKLQQAERFRVVTFDTWAHEGDPLRRTFLESLIVDLQCSNWVAQEKWDATLEEIAGRRSEKTTKTVPKLTKLGKIFAISVLAVPFGSAVLTSALREGAQFWPDPSAPIAWRLVIGTALSLAWAFVLLGNLIRFGWRKSRKTATGDEWNFLLSEAITTTITTTIETPEPTSVEFDQHFTSLLAEAVGRHDDRRLVLVLDNLDRIDQEEALALWSTLQTFLQDRHRGGNAWFSRLWVIVPYDPEGLRRLWDPDLSRARTPASSREADSKNEAKQRAPTEPSHRETSDFFLDKVFRLRLHVPRLLLKDWRAHLLHLAAEAFPDHRESDELRPLLSVFELHQRKTRQPPTPRDLKVYINQVGAIHRQWEHEFPWAHVGYYALLARSRTDIPAGLLEGRIPESTVVEALPSGLTASLAGMHFNVDKVTGQQLLLEEPIYGALTEPNSEGLAKLAENHGDGFWSVLANVASTRFVEEEGRVVARAAACLDGAGVSQDHAEFAGIRDAIVRSVSKESVWKPLDAVTARGIASACRLARDPAFSRALLSRVSKSQPLKPVKNEKVDVPALVEGWLLIIDTVVDLGHEEASQTAVPVACDAEGWMSACTVLGNADPLRWKCFQPSAEATGLASFFVSVIANGQLDQDHSRAILVTAGLATPPDLQPVVDALRARLDAANNVAPAEATHLLRCLLELRHLVVEEEAAKAKEFDDAGHYLHHLERCQSLRDPAATALCTYMALQARPAAGKPPAVGSSEQGHARLLQLLGEADEDLVVKLRELVLRFGTLLELLRIWQGRNKWDALVAACLQSLVEHEDAKSFFDIELVVGNWQALKSALEEALFAELVSLPDLGDRLATTIMASAFAMEDCGLYLAVAEREGVTDRFLRWCKEGLEQIQRQGWAEALADDNYGVDLLLALGEREQQPSLEASFIDAQIEHGEKVAEGSASPHRCAEHWAKVLGFLRESLRAEFRRKLLEFALRRDGSFSDPFFTVFGAELKLCEGLTHHETPSRLFAPLVQRRCVGGLTWLRDLVRDSDNVRARCMSATTFDVLKSRLVEALRADDGDGAQMLVQELADLLEVEQPEEAEPEAEGDAGDSTA
jgi:hypothetical protein